LDLLAQLSHTAGTTIVVVTHDEQVAARMRRQVRMLDGRIVSDTAASPAIPWPDEARQRGGWPGETAEWITGWPGRPERGPQ
jgi:putative ABC transport system ATP-binding protein